MDTDTIQRVVRNDREPYYSMYASLSHREESFKLMKWSDQLKPTAKELAEAGFFYTGYTDGTMCFYCGKGLYMWKETDNPYVEHATHFPNCTFLKTSKGEDFVRDIQKLVKSGHKNKKEEVTINATEEPPEVEVISGKECLICLTLERQIVFQPCGHFVTCVTCSYSLNKCCICRTNVINRLRAYSP